MQLSQRRLYELGLFQLASVTLNSDQVEDGIVPVQVTVAEAKHRQMRFSAGYGSEEHARGEAQWKHVNFFGGARTASVEGKWSSLNRGVRTQFIQPYVFTPQPAVDTLDAGVVHRRARVPARHPRRPRDADLRAVAAQRRCRAAARLDVLGRVHRRAGRLHDHDGGLEESLTDPDFRNQLIALGLDPRTGKGGGLLGAIALDYRRSTTPSVLDARRGYVFQTHAERAGYLLPGDFDYTEVTVEARHYQTLGRIGVLALRGRVGVDRRPRAGRSRRAVLQALLPRAARTACAAGAGFEVSPLSGPGLPLGGHSLMETSAEVRAPSSARSTACCSSTRAASKTAAWRFATPRSALRRRARVFAT